MVSASPRRAHGRSRAGSCAACYSEHFLEHLDADDARRFLRECRRVLAPGGACHVVVPDAGRHLRYYAARRNRRAHASRLARALAALRFAAYATLVRAWPAAGARLPRDLGAFYSHWRAGYFFGASALVHQIFLLFFQRDPRRFPRGDAYNHERAYDRALLGDELECAGFDRVAFRRFDPALDRAAPAHLLESLYAVARAAPAAAAPEGDAGRT